MSVTGHRDVRLADDFYRTPGWCVRAILPHLGDLSGKKVLEPGCGDGAIIDELPRDCIVQGVEKHHGRAVKARDNLGQRGAIWEEDFLDPQKLPFFAAMKPDVVIGNPPYLFAMEFVETALSVTKGPVVMLLRLAWLASQKRSAFLQKNTPSIFVLPKRPSFAMFVRCKKPCGWSVVLPSDAVRPTSCPKCSSPVLITTSDSADYAWFMWREPPWCRSCDNPARVHILSVPE